MFIKELCTFLLAYYMAFLYNVLIYVLLYIKAAFFAQNEFIMSLYIVSVLMLLAVDCDVSETQTVILMVFLVAHWHADVSPSETAVCLASN